MTGLMDEINWKISSRMEHLDQQTPSSIKKPHTSSPCIHSTNTTTIIMNIPPQSSLSTHRPSHTATSAAAVAAARRPAANGRGIATMLAHALHILLIMGGVPYAEGLLSIPPAKVISSIGRPSSRAALDSLSCGNARVVHSCSSGSSSRRRRRRRLVCMSRKEGAEDVCNAPAEDAFDLRRMDAQAEHVINWYPGHIAKAERELHDYLNMVDVVIEVRDCRIPAATTHQLVPKWVGNRPLIVVLNRFDTAPAIAVEQWKKYLVADGGLRADNRGGNVPVFCVDSKRGRGVHEIKKAALKAGARVNERRVRRGMNPRSVRVAVIGFPNVGKSALINRLVGKRVAKSMNVPGVTKRMNWIRLSGKGSPNVANELELLDSPGIIPARQEDQNQALKLAICNDIGQASYDTQVVAAKMVDQLVETGVQFPGYVNLDSVAKRYGIDPRRHTGEEYLHLVAKKMYFGEKNAAADKLLGDFRKGFLGNLSLEAPPAPNNTHNRLPLKQHAVAGGASGAGAGTSREVLGRLGGVGGITPSREPTVKPESDVIGAAAKEMREFVGTGDFEGW